MTPVPPKYSYLNSQRWPRILREALKLHGVLEMPGDANNPIIIQWAKEIGRPVSLHYQHDSTPWCGLYMAICAHRAGLELPPAPLWALSWSRWGNAIQGVPCLGDVLTFKRQGGGGHVALYVGEDKTHFHILGGNQRDSVCIVRKAKNELFAARRTKWLTAQPPNIRRFQLTPDGVNSGSEV